MRNAQQAFEYRPQKCTDIVGYDFEHFEFHLTKDNIKLQ